MSISSAPPLPKLAGTYDADAKAFLAWLVQASQEAAAAIRTPGFMSAGSYTAIPLSAANKIITLAADTPFVPGMYVRVFYILDPNVWLTGFVTAYNPTTKALTFEPDQVSGSGATYSAWVIEPCSMLVTKNGMQSEFYSEGGGGHGSTNTKIRRITSVILNKGTAITYADDIVYGASFTINENGLYIMNYGDNYSLGATSYGISLNTNEGATSIDAINSSAVMCRSTRSAANILSAPAKSLRFLVAGDVLRLHTDGQPDATTGNTCILQIRKVFPS